jgi:hypothetical protein
MSIENVLPLPNNSKKKRNWEQEILPFVKKELQEFNKEGVRPTLRTIFYRLASYDNVLRNVPGDYTGLSKLTSRCRKRFITLLRIKNIQGLQRYGLDEYEIKTLKSQGLIIQYNRQRHLFEKNLTSLPDMYDENKKYVLKLDTYLPVDCFADETRGFIMDFIDEYETPEQHIKKKLDFLSDLPDKYDTLLPKWHKQPYYVELWTEKNAMVGTFRSILKHLDVTIVYNRGFDSVTNAWETYQRIKKAWKQGKKVRILYFGDLDPSGDAMDETINEFMKICFEVEYYKERGDYDFKRVGVLYEHIDKFKLPKNLDEDVLAKLSRDKRREQFKKKYGIPPGKETDNQLFQIEIDALAAANPAEFKKMVLDAIKPFYDEEIYKCLLSDVSHSKKQICIQVMENVHQFIDEQDMKSMWEWLEAPT